MHRQSFYIDLHESHDLRAQEAFITSLRALVPQLPCPKCRPHLAGFLEAEPCPKPRAYEPEDYRFARYIWTLHNSVNARLHKPKVNFDTVVDYYVNNNQDALCAAQIGEPPVCETPKVPAVAVPVVVGVALLLLVLICICAALQAQWHN